MSANGMLTFLIYIDDKPFCFLMGSEQDVKDFVEKRAYARYEPMVTIMVQHGLNHSVDRSA